MIHEILDIKNSAMRTRSEALPIQNNFAGSSVKIKKKISEKELVEELHSLIYQHTQKMCMLIN